MAQFRHTARELLITYVKSDGNLLKFWALPATALEVVKNLENHYAKFAGELDKTSGYMRNSQTPVGMKLSVKSKIKRQWCRARVLDHSGYLDILVQLMDYGNEENISVKDARRMEDRLISIEPQAVECILADVVPPGTSEWPPEAIKFCESHLLYQTLSCYVVSSYLNIPVVRVAKGGESEPFVQRLINSGLALIKQEQPVPPAVSYKVNTMDANTAHLVKVSHVESIRKFYVQLSAAEVELQRLMDAIQKYVAQESLALLNVPLVSAACLAESDHLYRRARILAVLQGKCQIFYVDYGYTETKEFQELRAIPQYFMTLPAQAICCSLSSSDDREELRLVTKGYQLHCFVLGYNGDKCIVNLRRRVQDIITPRRISQQMPVYSVTYKKQKLSLGSSIEVTVSSITDITEFYCQLLCFKDQQEAIAFKLNSGYIFESLHINECIPGQAVCVKFHNKIWYRAEILKVNHEQDIEVFFVDIGNYEKVSLANIRKVNSELLNFPCQAYKCCPYETGNILNGVPKEEVLSLFQELTLGKNLKAQVQAFTEDNSYVITLYEMVSNISVFQKMESKILTASTVPVSDVENLFITSFTSPSLFFAQFEKLDSNLLSEMQEQINELYGSKENPKYIPMVGNLVCAKYEEDNQFYRALVISSKDSQFEVFFIDYGNRRVVPLRDIHPITKEFIKFPAFGIECSLESYPPGTPVDKLCSLMLENSIQARMITEKEKKWHITLTDDFPNNVAILELLRQHENVVPRPIHGIGGFQENRTRKENKYQFKINERDEIQPRLDLKQSYKKEQVIRNQMPQESENIVKTKESKVFQNYDVIEIPPNAYRNVYVSHVVSPSEFYCQIEEDSPKLLVLMKDIEDMYTFLNDNDLKLSTFALNSPCCAVFQEDGIWYRGQIRKINSNSCDIYFVDYGNTDTVPSSKIKMLKTELLSLPPQAIRCKSFNIVPKTGSWSDSDIEAFQTMTLDKSFVAQFVEQDDRSVYSVNLVSIGKLQEDVLNKEFVDLGHGQLADSSKILVLNSHAASSNLTYKSLDIKIGSTEPVKVTYGLNPGEIFCQLKCYSKEFETMMLNLQDYYNKVNEAEALVDRPHPGMICVAQFFLDSAWYRAEIKKVEKTTIVVFYVDYGNCETVDRKKIRCILQDFTLLPTQAVRCRIRGIKPPGKAWPCNENMGKYFEGNAECKFIEKDDDYYYIDLTCNMENVAQRLVKDKVAVFDEGVSESEQISVENNKTTISYKSKAASALPEKEQAFIPGQLISVIVSYIESPSKFWCQSLDESDMLEKLMSDIDGVFSQKNSVSSDLSTLTVGSYCMAKFSEDEAWYRAQIKSYVPGSGYEVFFIDYGNSETVSESEVKTITSDFMKLPPLCFECQLLHAPADCNVDNNTAFQNLIDEAEEITAKIEGRCKNVYVVTLLYDKDSEEININNVLFGSSSDIPEAVSKDARFLSPDVPLGLQDGYITVVNSPQDFYIQLSSCEDNLADLSSKLSDICEAMTDDKTTVQNPCVGLACCAKFSEDNNWYRAEILNLTDTTASVLFVDYGNVDDVPKTSLKILTEEYLQIPPYAIKCKLNGIIPVAEQWSEEAITTFQDIVLDSALAITFISKDIPAIVNVAKDDKDVAQYLVDMELANVDTCTEAEEAYAEDHLTSPLEEQFSLSNDQSYPNRKISSSELLVKISYVDTYDKFYVVPLELSTELDTITKTLELLYRPDADKPPIPIEPEDIKANMPCVAKCGDGTWCRAIITEVDGDNIYVTLVDYGNPERLSIKNLRVINPELVEIPPVAVECSLFGVQAIEGNEKKITTKLDEYFLDETELMMEICESKPYKVKLNCNGDFAEMLIAEGLAKFDSSAKSEQISDNFVSGSSIIVDEEPSKVKNIITTYSVSGLDEMLVNAKYAEIENDLIILHVVPVDADLKLEVMQERLQTVYNESENKVIQVKQMDFCVAKYTEDESWYRAKVIACCDGKVKVKFIDYGNCDTVDMENICELLPEFVEACQFSIKFCLSGFKMFENKSEELQNKLDEYVYNEPLLLKLCKYKHDVPGICTAKVLFGDTDLTELLIDEELLFQQYVLNSEIDNSFEATIEHNKGGILYVLPVKLKEDRDNFQAELEKYCNKCEMVASINKWCLYAAKYNEHWFRSTVLSCSSDEADVKFVDFGHEATVKISNLVSLPAEISHQPVFLQPCVVKEIEGVLDDSYEKILDKIPSDTAVFCELLETQSYPHAVKLSFTDPEFSLLTDSANEAPNTYCESVEKKDAESAIKSESDNESQPQLNDDDESSLIYDLNSNTQGKKINEELEPLNNKYSDKSDDFGFDDPVRNSQNSQPILNDLSIKEVEVSNEETKLEKQFTDLAKDDDFDNRDEYIVGDEHHHGNFSENESFSDDKEVNPKIDSENSDEFKLPAEQFESVPELDEYEGFKRKGEILPSPNPEDSGYSLENSSEMIEDNHDVLDDNDIPEYKESTNASREPMQLMNNTVNHISNAETSSADKVPKPSDCETFAEGSTDNRHLSGSVKVIVSSIAISNDGSIILAVIPMQFQEQLSNFNRDLNLAYSSKDLSSSYNPESKFCAVCTDENEWRRAQVIHEEEKLTVSFIDYGVIDSVDISTAQDLDPKFASIPPFAVWCTLAAISCSSNKSIITKEYLENTVKGKEAVITIIEDNEPYQVSLYVDGLDIINELFLNDMVACKFGTANIEPGHYSAKMSHLTTELKHLELFVNLIPQWESFKSLQSSMQNAYSVKNEETQVRKLQAYAVWHNGKWSRCTILSCDDKIILNLIDSGEIISYSSTLCPLLPEHCLHPPYAIPCEIPSFICTDQKDAADMLNDILGSEFLVYVERDVHTDSLVSRLEDATIFNRLKNMQEILSCPDLEETTSEQQFDQSEPAQEAINVSHSDTSQQKFDESEPAQETINVFHSDTSEREFDQSEPAQETNVSHSDTSEPDFDQNEPAQETINISFNDSYLKSDETQEQKEECPQNETEPFTEVLEIPQADDMITQKEELRSELPHVDSDSFHPEQEENKELTSNDCLEKDESKDDINECDTTEISQAITDSFDFEKKEQKELRVKEMLEDNLKNEIVSENAHIDSELRACDVEQESISKCEQLQESFRKTELLETTHSSSSSKPEKEEIIGYLKESFSTQPLQECRLLLIPQAITDSFDFEKKEQKELRVKETLEDNLKNEIVSENAHIDSELRACDVEQESISKCEQLQESFRKTELLETTHSSSSSKPEKEEIIGYLKESFSTQPLQECSERID